MKEETSESGISDVEYEETELTLGLPGKSAGRGGGKRGFAEAIGLRLGSSEIATPGSDGSSDVVEAESSVSSSDKPLAAKAQVVGWPPVRSFRKNTLKSCRYVKVAVDGAPYLRKVDLEMYSGYQQLFKALEQMFTCFTIRQYTNETKMMDRINGTEYVPTYEDKDGDWMLVGDVPWKMFVESCNRLRLMKSSEAMGLAPRTPPKCSS